MKRRIFTKHISGHFKHQSIYVKCIDTRLETQIMELRQIVEKIQIYAVKKCTAILVEILREVSNINTHKQTNKQTTCIYRKHEEAYRQIM